MGDMAERHEVEKAIRDAFANVVLGNGISLEQTRAIDLTSYSPSDESSNYPDKDYESLKKRDIVDDWSLLTSADLERLQTAWLDPEGFRYYLPALMIDALYHHDTGSWRWIGLWVSIQEVKHFFSALNDQQMAACALFVTNLRGLVELDYDEEKVLERRLEKQWAEYLQT